MILIRGPHGGSTREELLHAKAEEDISLSLYYNRKNKKGEIRFSCNCQKKDGCKLDFIVLHRELLKLLVNLLVI